MNRLYQTRVTAVGGRDGWVRSDGLRARTRSHLFQHHPRKHRRSSERQHALISGRGFHRADFPAGLVRRAGTAAPPDQSTQKRPALATCRPLLAKTGDPGFWPIGRAREAAAGRDAGSRPAAPGAILE